MNITGQMTLNNVDDKGLIVILEVKDKTSGLGFNPNSMQQVPIQGQQPKTAYNNVIITWSQGQAIKGVIEILTRLGAET